MRIKVWLEVDSAADVDAEHAMGITAAAYDRLVDASIEAGFTIVDGPIRDTTEA